jgi:hypothetical protein
MALAGCNSDWLHEQRRSVQANTTVPANYRADVVAFMRIYLNDPSGVRDAQISEPELRDIDHSSRYSVCLRYNARKTGGQYAGSKDSLIVFSDGRLDRIIDNGRERCRSAAYQPFPELERMTR